MDGCRIFPVFSAYDNIIFKTLLIHCVHSSSLVRTRSEVTRNRTMSQVRRTSRLPFVGMRILVTGASSGLGYQCALALAVRGATVVLVARRRGRLEKLRAKARNLAGRTLVVTGDLARVGEITRLSGAVIREIGGIDILVNNAAVYMEDSEIVATNLDDWMRFMNTNLRAPYLLCRAFVPGMVARGYGRVINILSAKGELGGAGAYRISKIGLEVLTAVLARELRGTGVATLGINPGWMRTEMSESGNSPRGVAKATIDLLELGKNVPNGAIFDLRRRGRKFYFYPRRAARSRYGP